MIPICSLRTIARFGPLLVLMDTLIRASGASDYADQVRNRPIFLTPIGYVGLTIPTEAESKDLLRSFDAFNASEKSGLEALEQFLASYPESAWRPSLETHLAEYYRNHGRFTRALGHWECAWKSTKDAADKEGRSVAEEVLARWTRLLASLGRLEQLQSLFDEARSRGLDTGRLQPLIEATQEGVNKMRLQPGISYRCGSFALYQVARALHPERTELAGIPKMDSPTTGFNLSQLQDLAVSNHIGLVAARRTAGTEIIVPSVVHWRQNHYAAILERLGNRYKVSDPTFGEVRWFEADAINEEASGNFLIPTNQLQENWRKLAPNESSLVFGKGYPNDLNDDDDADDGCDDSGDNGDNGMCPSSSASPPTADDDCASCPNPSDPPANQTSCDCKCPANSDDDDDSQCPIGMPVFRISQPYICQWLSDIPIFYRDSHGRMIKFQVTFKHRATDVNTAAAGLGNNWSCNWISDLQYDSTMTTVAQFIPGGGKRALAADGSTPEFKRGFVTTAGGSANYVTTYRGGATNLFGYSQPFATGITNFFLTNRTDRFGKVTALTWVPTVIGSLTVHRLTKTVDPDGNGFTLSYTNSTYPNLITGVTDPYGRAASFVYDSSGRLVTIVDMAGMSSSFSYGSGNLIASMTTPYGTTSFTYQNSTNYNSSQPHTLGHSGISGFDRAMTVTEPNGAHQLFAYVDNGPEGYRNSYHWNRLQYQSIAPAHLTNLANLDINDFIMAKQKVFLHKTANSPYGVNTLQLSGTAASVTPPSVTGTTGARLTSSTWGYPNQDPSGYYEGTSGMSSARTRVTGGVTHTVNVSRTSYGRVSQRIRQYATVDGGMLGTVTNNYDFDQGGRRLLRKWGPNGVMMKGYGYSSTFPYLINTITNAVGDVTTYGYDTNLMKVSSITLPTGQVISNLFYGSGTYKGWLQYQIVVGISTNSYSYTNGNPQVLTDPVGLVITNTWDNLNRLSSVQYPDGTTISNVFNKLDLTGTKDRLGNWTYFGYDSMRNRTSITNANNAVTQFVYCTCGSLSQVIDPLGQNTYYYYDIIGRMTNAVYPDGHTLSLQYFDDGKLSQITDAGGRTVTFAYDSLGNVVQVRVPSGGNIVVNQYDGFGRLTNSLDANAVTTAFTYDLLGRITSKTITSGTATTVSTEAFIYTPFGMTNYVNPLGHTNWYVYDSIGRLLSQTNANLERLAFSYNANNQLVSLTDGKNHVTTWNYDLYGRITNKVSNTGQTLFAYAYDAVGRLTNRWTPAKTNATYRYDAVGNLTNVTYAVNSALVLQYDANNQLTKMIDGLGTSQFSYTAAGQLASEDGPWVNDFVNLTYANRQRASIALQQPNASTWQQTYTYDIAMRLTGISSPDGAYAYSYSPSLPYSVTPIPAKLTFPSLAAINYSYDDIGRLTASELQDPSGNILNHHGYSYDLSHQRTNEVRSTDSSGLSGTHPRVDYGYDPKGQLISSIASDDNSYGSLTTRPHESFGYSYDAAGNLAIRTNNPGGNQLLQSFSVDSLNQLTSATRSGLMTVSGLASGGTTSVTVNGSSAQLFVDGSFAKQGLTLANGNNTFTATAQDAGGRKDTNSVTINLPSSSAYVYDLNGNLTSDGRRGFVYDDENQLISVTVTNVSMTQFIYDGFLRRRITRDYFWASGTWMLSREVHYIYDGMLVVQERDQYNIPQVTYTRGQSLDHHLNGAGGIGGLLSRTDMSTGQTAYYHSDAGGNVTMLINAQSAVVASYRYDPFGNLTGISGPLATGNSQRFSSKEWHGPSGLYYYGYRFYEPNLQRWLNRDPIEEMGGINLYAYVLNDPVNQIDPYGLHWTDYIPDFVTSRGAVNFAAGMGDNLSFGLTDMARNALDINDSVNKCAGAYSAGEWAGTALSAATGVAGGIKAAGVKGAGKEFSHWIPNRMGGPRSIWNGNYVSPARHYFYYVKLILPFGPD